MSLSAGTWLGAQLPDIDHPNSKITRFCGPVGKFISSHLGHRTWTHSIWGILVMLIICFLIPNSFTAALPVKLGSSIQPVGLLKLLWIGVTIGYFLHILEDSFSRQGVCWFYPFSNFSYYYHHPYKPGHKHWWNYRTGGSAEAVIRWISTILLVIVWFLYLD